MQNAHIHRREFRMWYPHKILVVLCIRISICLHLCFTMQELHLASHITDARNLPCKHCQMSFRNAYPISLHASRSMNAE